jgi:hypothetical protein
LALLDEADDGRALLAPRLFIDHGEDLLR